MRRKIEKILALCLIALAISFAAVYLYFAVMGRTILTNQLKDITRRKVTMGYFSLAPNLKLEIKDLDIQGLAKFRLISASPSISAFLKGKLVLNQLTLLQPELFINRTPPDITEARTNTVAIVPPAAVPAPLSLPEQEQFIPFGIARLNIRGGKITFIDQTVSSGSLKIVIQDIELSMKNLYLYPASVITAFDLKAVIPWRDSEEKGKVELDGWVNPLKKDMRATLKIKDIDAVYLYPYYSQWVDLRKARIERANLNFTSEIHGLNNEVKADCRIELSDMVRKPLEIGEPEEKASKLTDAVLDNFKAQDNGSVKLNFVIKTKMDSPQFGFDNFKAAFEDKLMKGRVSRFRLQDTIAIPMRTIQTGVQSLTDLSRAMIDGILTLGDDIKRSTAEIFRRGD